jgi:hypothetical protein
MAKTLINKFKNLSSSRTTIIFDYDDAMNAVINTNHDHNFGPKNQESFIKWEGSKGAIKAKMGLLLDYPKGVPDHFEYCLFDAKGSPEWKTMELEGSWFPDAFIGTMSSVMPNDSTRSRSRSSPSTDHASSSLGDLRRAREALEQGLARAENEGDVQGLLFMRGNLIGSRFSSGDWDGAVALALRVCGAARLLPGRRSREDHNPQRAAHRPHARSSHRSADRRLHPGGDDSFGFVGLDTGDARQRQHDLPVRGGAA